MKRWYKKTNVPLAPKHAHMAGVTITVHKERFVWNEGESDIPHRIALAVATSIDWLDHAISQITVTNYLSEQSTLAKVYLQVYRHAISPPVRNPSLPEREQIKQQKNLETEIKNELLEVKEKLQKIRVGLGKSQIIKVNDAHTVTDKGEIKHYLGLVKPASKTEYGKITIGFRAFREGHNLARILIHEAAHKYTLANDGKNTGGYWNKQFSDYLDPVAMHTTACKQNADSHALFVWAMNNGRGDTPDISSEFTKSMQNRWEKHRLSH